MDEKIELEEVKKAFRLRAKKIAESMEKREISEELKLLTRFTLFWAESAINSAITIKEARTFDKDMDEVEILIETFPEKGE